MTRPEAEALVELLTAAFPHPRVPDLTVALYRDELERLPDVEAARAAVQALIANEERFPVLAVLLREYRPAARRNAEQRARSHGLEEPEPDWAENARRAQQLRDRLGRAMTERATEGGLSDWQSGDGEGDT
jgi:hypothetical protein